MSDLESLAGLAGLADLTHPANPAQPSPRSAKAPPALDRDQLDRESAQVLDAMPRRGGMGTARVAQRAGVSPGAALHRLGELASAGFVERCDGGWRLRRT
jgi:DNA processing protein